MAVETHESERSKIEEDDKAAPSGSGHTTDVKNLQQQHKQSIEKSHAKLAEIDNIYTKFQNKITQMKEAIALKESEKVALEEKLKSQTKSSDMEKLN